MQTVNRKVGWFDGPLVGASAASVDLMLPLTDSIVDASRPVTFEWIDVAGAKSYRIEVESDGKLVITSSTETTRYTPPPGWIAARVKGFAVWRVSALDARDQVIAVSATQAFTVKP